jgi:dUTP pyrophosphatase
MKLKIKVKELTEGCMPSIIQNGDWIDLVCAEDMKLNITTLEDNPDVKYIPLGIAMQLPKGFEAIVAPRSSTPNKFGIMCANSFGVIDNCYCGNNDEWKFPVIAIRPTFIEKGCRICQFKIQLSQKATLWQKIKWLFSSGIELVKVDNLQENSRGGFGSTGTK